jgi:FMN phosphatase YigB (HAD superfamily)
MDFERLHRHVFVTINQATRLIVVMNIVLIRTKVIHNTFSPYLSPEREVPPELITELYQEFSSSRPYSLYFDTRHFINGIRTYKKAMSTNKHPEFGRLVVGIITNSDDRVPSILESFDIRIGPKRVGTSSQVPAQPSRWHDIDFVVHSYDVGYEKPDRRIFDAATALLSEKLAEEGKGESADDFEKLYLGDDLENDYMGAKAAGWDAALIDRKSTMDKAERYAFEIAMMKDKEGNEREVWRAKSLLTVGRWQQMMLSDPTGE